MRAGFQKAGRYLAGRLQGSKGVQKYDKFMDNNALARGLLTGADIGAAALGGLGLVKAAPAIGGMIGNAAKGKSVSDLFTAKTAGNMLGKLGSSEVLGGVAKGLYGERQAAREAELEREKMAQGQQQFDATMALKEKEYAMAAAQEADRKRREEQMMANRAALRAMFGGA